MAKLQAETTCTSKMRHIKETMEPCVSQGSTFIQLQGQGIYLPLWFLRFEPPVDYLHHLGPGGKENVMVVDGHLKVTGKQGERGGDLGIKYCPYEYTQGIHFLRQDSIS